jgi:hypothetical protein
MQATKFELQAGVVGTNSDGTIEGKSVRSERAFPYERIIGEDFQLVTVHLCAKIVGVSGAQERNGFAALRFNVAIATIATLCAGVLARITFDGNHELRFGFDAPHGINQVAGILGAEFQAELAAEFTGAEACFVSRRAEIGEMGFDGLGSESIQIGTHFGYRDREAAAG